ncbi:GNAT family N-acetyltransferase, partial [Phenylobacterium sp.]|uniref:GNAT family N-acetyltransferase n=1 Tax=Phenylobacterium sp. TaxID=1871053 RepID=UPI0011F41FDF
MAAEEAVSIAAEDPTAGEAAGLIADLVGYLTALYPEDDEEGPPPWTVEDLARERTFLVARIGGEAAGCGGLTILPWPDAMEIVRMYVQPHRRGRRLAERLLIDLEALARERGVGVLMLRCGPRQPQALRVYERSGYVRRAAFAHHREH